MIEHTLATLKALKPNLSQVYFRSDNAGCYHCAYLLLSLPTIAERTGFKIARYDFSEPQAGKGICDRRIAALKSHMRRFINEGNDVKTASDMRAAMSHTGESKAVMPQCVESRHVQTMTKHTMAGVQALHNFLYENGGLRVWRAYDVGPGKFYSAVMLARFGTPQGPTELVALELFSIPHLEAGTYQQHPQPTSATSEPGPLKELPFPSQTEHEREMFSCQEEGCIKTFKSFAALQKHLDVGKHLVKLAKESAYDEIKRKWTEACHSVSGGYVRGQTLASSSEKQSPPGQVENGWALRRTRKSVAFSEKAKSYLLDVFWMGEETGKKATASDVALRMKSARNETGQKIFSKIDWLTEQQIARYFSRLSALNKSGQLPRTSSVSMNEDEEVDADELAAEIETVQRRQQIRRELEL